MSLRYFYRLIQEFIKRFSIVIIGGIVVGVFVFLILSLILPSAETTHQRIGIVGRFTTDNLPSEITTRISSGLTKIGSDGNVSPALAKSWEPSDDGKTWTFYLDENARWQDEHDFKSQDINYEFSDATIKFINDNEVQFKLDSVFSAFPIVVAKPIFKRGLIGTSKWKVKNITLSGEFVQKIVLIDGAKNKLTYKFYPSDERVKLAFKMGEIDVFKIGENPESFNSWRHVTITEEIKYDNLVVIFINNDDEKLNNKEIRQALNYAISKDNLNGPRALSPISPNSWSFNPQVKQYLKDEEKGKSLKDLNLKLSTLPNLLDFAEYIKAEWESFGAVVEIEVVSDVPKEYQTFLATMDIPKDPDQYSLWHSTQDLTNISRVKNPRLDKLLEDGRTELDQEARKKIYLDFQRFIVEEVPAIFLYHPKVFYVSRP